MVEPASAAFYLCVPVVKFGCHEFNCYVLVDALTLKKAIFDLSFQVGKRLSLSFHKSKKMGCGQADL